MIDTLRFANRLKQAGFTDQQSEAFAEAWAEQARDDLPSRADMIALDSKVDRIRTELEGKIDRLVGRIEGRFDPLMDRLRRKLDKLTWMVGFTLAGVVAVIVRLLFAG